MPTHPEHEARRTRPDGPARQGPLTALDPERATNQTARDAWLPRTGAPPPGPDKPRKEQQMSVMWHQDVTDDLARKLTDAKAETASLLDRTKRAHTLITGLAESCHETAIDLRRNGDINSARAAQNKRLAYMAAARFLAEYVPEVTG